MKAFLSLLFCFCTVFAVQAEEKTVIRVGHFPNLTHAQALIGHHLSRKGKGWFEERMGPNVQIEWHVYNAGPTAMEGIFADSIDISYVGPNPAINAYLRSKGEEIRVVCGSCSGGAALVVQGDGRIQKVADFKGKKVGTPQLGNTQDVAARDWLESQGFNVTLTGGDVLVVPTANPDQLALFKSGDLDAIWTIEPWVSRLVLEAKGVVFLEESTLWPQTSGKYVTTQLVTSVAFLKQRRELLKKWIAAHIELTQWMAKHPDEAKAMLQEEIKAETFWKIPNPILERAWTHLEFTYDPVPRSLFKAAEDQYEVGFLKTKPDVTGIYDLSLLEEVLAEK